MAASEQAGLAGSLVLFSYPLHPPGRPEQLRNTFFPQLQTPALFVHGTRDTFGTIEELRANLVMIPARTEVIAIEGAGHDLKRAPERAQEIIQRMLF
jgi:predicted alpha/beta-hydrolase family hydrolase